MKAKVRITKNFKRQAKKLMKKHASLSKELTELQELLKENPFLGKKLNNNYCKFDFYL